MATQAYDELLHTLQRRFDRYPKRHPGVSWPDVIGQDPASGRLTFCDCSAEPPSGRRSLCW